MARIRFDITKTTVVVFCDDCRGRWSELANDRDEARRLAARHESDVHPDTRQSVRAAQLLRETRRQQHDRHVAIREDNDGHGS